MAFKDLATSDYVVGQVWGARKADRFLLDQIRRRMDMPTTKEAVKALSRQWPKAATKLIEDKANGPAVIQELRHEVMGLIEVHPEGGKIARANAVSPQVESGNVYLPHPAIAPWVEDLLNETAAFPNGSHDDQVDAMTQALNRLRGVHGIFSVADSQFTVNPFAIPEAWPRAYGMVVTPAAVGALWGARDPGGTIFLYAEHLFSHPEPSQNAKALQAQGSWIPGVLNLNGPQADRYRVVELYRQFGLNLQVSMPGEEAGLYRLLQLLASSKLKVFASLSGFLAEYRVGDEQSPLLLCCQSLVLSRDRMRTRPVKKPEPVPYVPSGDRGWMV
jgi:predicted phage terminase large subunit-like protein